MALAWVAQAASFLSVSLYSFLALLYISGWFLSHSAISSSCPSVILTSLFFLNLPWDWLSWVASSKWPESSVSSGWVARVAVSPWVRRCVRIEEKFASDDNCSRCPAFIVSSQFAATYEGRS